MVPSGGSTPIGNAQSVPPSLLRSNSGMMNGQPSQTSFSSLVSPRSSYSNMNMMNQPFPNQRMDAGAEPDPLSSFASDPQPDPQSFHMRNMNLSQRVLPVKMEPGHSDPQMYLQQQQSQQHLMQMSRQSNMLAQQKLLHLQHQQHQQHQQQQQQQFKGMPIPMPMPMPMPMPQQRPQFQQMRPSMKPYEPGMCARRLTHYMFQQQRRPEDNNIEFWRKFVAEYFAPQARKKWCVSMYGSGRVATGVFPQDTWHCEICNKKPGRGFEAAVELLPRLFKIKYESGTLEELLYIDMPKEYQNSCGQIVLDYAKAIQESVFEQLRVVREGQLRIVFSLDLKICSWEFCARRHEELIPRRLLIPQVSQVGAAAQKYTQNASANMSIQELQNNCNIFVASARNLAKSLEFPLVNELGYTKRYVRCLQISEVVNSLKDLIDYSRETGTGPMESLTKFPRRTASLCGAQSHQAEEPRQMGQEQQQIVNTNMPSSSTSASAIVGMLHQNANIPTNISSMGDVDNGDSVQKLIQDMLMANPMSAGGMVGIGSFQNDVKNGPMINPGLGGAFGLGQAGVMNGMRSAIGNNSMNGRMMGREPGLNHHPELGGQLVSGLGPINGFNNNLQFDWKPSP